MAATRLWYCVLGIAALLLASIVMPAHGSEDGDGGGLSAQEAELLADFLILAVKPEGDDRDYKLIEIGDTKINAGLLGVVVNALPLDFLGLGPEKRDYDEAAEVAQCRAACRANTACRDFVYVRPNANQPVGVCHLKRLTQTGFGVMTPVVDAKDHSERPIREPATADAGQPAETIIVIDGNDTSGSVRYANDDARLAPVIVKFTVPVASAKIFVRAAVITSDRIRATVETFDAKGKSVERGGTWISTGSELNFGHAIAIGKGDSDRIATVKITTPNPGAVLLDGLEYARTLITPPVVAEVPPKTEPPREIIPPPPRLPPVVAEYFPLPPRAMPTAPPTDITVPRTPIETPPETAPPPEAIETPAPPPPAPPITTVAETPAPPLAAQPARKRGLPLWLALGAIAVMLAGAGTYWRNHRARMMNRLTTRLVSNGLERQSITIETAGDPDHSLRVVVRAPANSNARIELIPKGEIA
jgi:hypothetical protein